MTKKKFKEPVFYFNLKGNCFLIGEYITPKSIILNPNSQIPQSKGKIEFSFPNSEYVVSCEYEVDSASKVLNLLNLKDLDRKNIKNYIEDDYGK